MPTRFQVAARRNAIARDASEFLQRVSDATGLDRARVQILSAEESFDHQALGQRQAPSGPLTTRFALPGKAVELLVGTLAEELGSMEVVVRLMHFEHLAMRMSAKDAFTHLPAMLAFDTDLVSVASLDNASSLVVDANENGTVDVTLRGAWMGFAASLS